jgi:carbon storage regulator CsrA
MDQRGGMVAYPLGFVRNEGVTDMGLILTRKDGQTVVINGNIKITVYSPARVQLDIEAPKGVPIRRGELEERKDAA